jgi:hypothetical protein
VEEGRKAAKEQKKKKGANLTAGLNLYCFCSSPISAAVNGSTGATKEVEFPINNDRKPLFLFYFFPFFF